MRPKSPATPPVFAVPGMWQSMQRVWRPFIRALSLVSMCDSTSTLWQRWQRGEAGLSALCTSQRGFGELPCISWQSEQVTSSRSFRYIFDFRKSAYCWCGLFEWMSSGQMLSSRPPPRMVGPFLTGSV